jgi:hypothetical protein
VDVGSARPTAVWGFWRGSVAGVATMSRQKLVRRAQIGWPTGVERFLARFCRAVRDDLAPEADRPPAAAADLGSVIL